MDADVYALQHRLAPTLQSHGELMGRQAFGEGIFLREAKQNLNLHGLNLDLRSNDLMVFHTTAQMANAHADPFAGSTNLGNTCFINATLQVFLHAPALWRIASPLPPLAVGMMTSV